MNKQNVIKVPIMGQEYIVNTTAPAKYINDIAAYVNDKMSEIQNSGIEQDSQLRIAVLAAMNITDELFMGKENREKLFKTLEQKTNKVSKLVEKEIQKLEK